jgi:threonine/homoserine efflux transporter RhtA
VTNDRRPLGIAMMLGAVGLLAFAYLLSGYAGWFSWVLVAIAAFNFVRGLLWFLNRKS